MTLPTIHTKATQGAGYAKGAVVLFDGCQWKSLVANNTHPPEEGAYWTLVN